MNLDIITPFRFLTIALLSLLKYDCGSTYLKDKKRDMFSSISPHIGVLA